MVRAAFAATVTERADLDLPEEVASRWVWLVRPGDRIDFPNDIQDRRCSGTPTDGVAPPVLQH